MIYQPADTAMLILGGQLVVKRALQARESQPTGRN
jgi:hypothetical protein